MIGLVFIFRGVMEMKQYGEMRATNSAQARMKPTLIFMGVGAAFLFYPSLINSSLNTVFGENNILQYTESGGLSGQGQIILQTVELMLRLIGYISFFRGWVLMTQLAGQQAQQGTLGRSLAHIFGGIFLVNIFATWQIITTFFGFGASSA